MAMDDRVSEAFALAAKRRLQSNIGHADTTTARDTTSTHARRGDDDRSRHRHDDDGDVGGADDHPDHEAEDDEHMQHDSGSDNAMTFEGIDDARGHEGHEGHEGNGDSDDEQHHQCATCVRQPGAQHTTACVRCSGTQTPELRHGHTTAGRTDSVRSYIVMYRFACSPKPIAHINSRRFAP